LRRVRSWAEGPDEEDDLVQDIWQRVIEKRTGFRGTGSFQGWLFQIARSVCADHARSRASMRAKHDKLAVEAHRDPAAEPPAGPPAGPPLDHLADRATHERARHAVQALPERQREVVTLRVLGELSTRETAHAMGCAEGTVKASLSQALASLRTKLAHEIHINMHDE
jgi:RNA polymerase sigma-70 factor (ECF subfamily)